jgi:hypothetical protein
MHRIPKPSIKRQPSWRFESGSAWTKRCYYLPLQKRTARS